MAEESFYSLVNNIGSEDINIRDEDQVVPTTEISPSQQPVQADNITEPNNHPWSLIADAQYLLLEICFDHSYVVPNVTNLDTDFTEEDENTSIEDTTAANEDENGADENENDSSHFFGFNHI